MMIPEHIVALLGHGKIYSHDRDGQTLIFPGYGRTRKDMGEGRRPDHHTVYRNPSQVKGRGAGGAGRGPRSLPQPSFTWNLSDFGRVGGVPHWNRERPDDFRQREYLQLRTVFCPQPNNPRSPLIMHDARTSESRLRHFAGGTIAARAA